MPADSVGQGWRQQTPGLRSFRVCSMSVAYATSRVAKVRHPYEASPGLVPEPFYADVHCRGVISNMLSDSAVVDSTIVRNAIVLELLPERKQLGPNTRVLP